MIRLRYPVGLGIAAALLVVLSIALSTRAAEVLESANVALSGPSAEQQPSQEDFLAYSMSYNVQYLLVQLVPWVVLAAALTGIGALMLLVLRSRQSSTVVPATQSERAR